MNDQEFKARHKKGTCLSCPFEHLIPSDIRKQTLLAIKNESIDKYGYDLTIECPKRTYCDTKKCLGRPLPYLSKTALPYLKKLEKTHKIIPDTQEGAYNLFVETCEGCPIAKTCTKPCSMIYEYLHRDKVQEPWLNYKSNIENYEIEDSNDVEATTNLLTSMEVPWDCLTPRKAETIRKYLFEQRDFNYVADFLDLNNGARVKYEFYSALTKLSEFAAMRLFLKNHNYELSQKQYKLLKLIYIDNLSLTKVSKKLNISKPAVGQSLARVIKKYKISWQVFVHKHDGKVIYNVPMVLK